jgi:hypothetical protein
MSLSYPIVETVLSTPTVEQINIYNRQEWPQPFLRELLFEREHVFSGPAVQINYRRFRRALAPFVNIFQNGRMLQEGPRGVQSILLPAFGPTRVIRADDALSPPTSVYAAPRGTDYITGLMSQNWVEMEQSLSTREEWQIAQLLTTGTIDIVGDDPGDPAARVTLTYEINPPIALTGADAWDATSAPDLVAWLTDQARRLAAKCGVRPDVLILGASAARAFLSNAAVMRERTLLANLVDTSPEFEDAATTFIGRYAGIDCYEYNAIYVESSLGEDDKFSDVVLDMIPAGCAILASTALSGAMCYGGISVTENNQIVVHAARRVPISWPDRDNSLWKQRVSSRFAPAPADSGSWQTFSSVLGQAPATETKAQSAGGTHQVRHK